MYIAHTVPGRYTLKPLSLVLYLEDEEALRGKSKGLLAQNRDYVAEWDNTSFRRLVSVNYR